MRNLIFTTFNKRDNAQAFLSEITRWTFNMNCIIACELIITKREKNMLMERNTIYEDNQSMLFVSGKIDRTGILSLMQITT